MINRIEVHSTCTVVFFDNGASICSHGTDDYDNDTGIRLAPNLRVTSDLDLNECLVAYWVDRNHKQWFCTTQDEIVLQWAAEHYPDRIYFILVPATI